MNTNEILMDQSRKFWIILLVLGLILIVSVNLASQVQRDFGNVAVGNVFFENENGIRVRAKLLKPVSASPSEPVPGVVYIHGYQNNRETSDAYAIEMARRGFVVLEIDAIGRGNSGIPDSQDDPAFDPSFGGQASFDYLKSLSYVKSDSVGLMGHSLGAEMVYSIALQDQSVKALVISGFAYTEKATQDNPNNMLMIFGEYDEYRERMTGTNDVRGEWLMSPQTKAAFGEGKYEFGKIYGNFEDGTARKVELLPVIHLKESHSTVGVAAAVSWMKDALKPDPALWIDADRQIWEFKEYATLVAMFSGLYILLPLGALIIKSKYFSTLTSNNSERYNCPRKNLLKHSTINGILMWLYLPIIFVLFGLHVYVVPIDNLFPMMMVNGTVWWFFWINVIGFIILRRWFKKNRIKYDLSWYDLGISFRKEGFSIDWKLIGKTTLAAGILFVFAYAIEHILEAIYIVDYRFIFPFVSDLTFYRLQMWFIYFPFLLAGFLQLGFFLHGQIRISRRKNWIRTFFIWSQVNTLVLIVPIILFLLVQYLPIFLVGVVPFVGPGGMLVSFTMNLFHIIGVLIIIVPIQTWFYQLTRRPYLGAILNAAIVSWMFVSSQVIAPIPV